ITNAAGATTVTTLDSQGHAVYAHTVTVDGNMNKLADTDGAGNPVVTYTYNDPNDPYTPDTVTDGNGHTWHYVDDQFGNVQQITNTTTNGITTTYTYAKDAGQNTLAGEVATITDNAGHRSTFTYDSRGNLASSTDASNNSTSYTVNLADQITAVTDPATGMTG